MIKRTMVILSLILASISIVSCSDVQTEEQDTIQKIDFTVASEDEIREYLKTVDNNIESYTATDEINFDLQYDFIEMDTINGGTLKEDLDNDDENAKAMLVFYGLSVEDPVIQQVFSRTDTIYYNSELNVIDRKLHELSMNSEWEGNIRICNDILNNKKYVSENANMYWEESEYISDDVNYISYYISDDFLTNINNITSTVNENDVTITGNIRADKSNVLSAINEPIDFSLWDLADTELPVTIIIDKDTDRISSIEIDMKGVMATLFSSDNKKVKEFLDSEYCEINGYTHKFTYKDYNTTVIDRPAGLPKIDSTEVEGTVVENTIVENTIVENTIVENTEAEKQDT